MSHFYLDSTPSKSLASHTSTVGRLAVLTACVCIGRGFIERIGKLENKQRERKLSAPCSLASNTTY